MRSIAIATTTLLITLVSAIDIRNEHKTAVDSQCFICPPVKSFRFGIRPWQRYEPTDIKFHQHENSFSCIYQAATYVLPDKHDPVNVIGRCNYYNDGVLRRENKDKDTASSLECPSTAPVHKGCSYRVHAARAVEKRQEQTLQENIPAPPQGDTVSGQVVVNENEPDENEEDEQEETGGDEEEEEGDEEEGNEEESDDEEGNEEEDEEDGEEDEDENENEGEEEEEEDEDEDEGDEDEDEDEESATR